MNCGKRKAKNDLHIATQNGNEQNRTEITMFLLHLLCILWRYLNDFMIFFPHIFLCLRHYLSYDFRIILSWNCHKLVKVIFSVRRYASAHVMLSVRNKMSENVRFDCCLSMLKFKTTARICVLTNIHSMKRFRITNRIFVWFSRKLIQTGCQHDNLPWKLASHWIWWRLKLFVAWNKSVCIRLFLMAAEIDRVNFAD